MKDIISIVIIFIIIIAIIAAYIMNRDKKENISKTPNFPQKENIDEVTELEKYNAIIDLSNQIQITNILLFLILVILFIKLLLPSILTALGIGYVINELNNII